jgi:predicted MFS family arabinose efflux permease
MNTTSAPSVFTRYQAFVIAVLAFTQFTVILDFMILSPMGPILLKDLNIVSSQFSLVVSAYAFSAFASGLLAAGFADKFDRKKLLLFFYAGFVVGTIFCAMAPTYHFLLMARIVAGLFGGVINSLSFAIITDLFKMEVRGRVMGIVQMAFAASQALGIPAGLWASAHYGWHIPFWAIAGTSAIVGLTMLVFMKPVNEHLKIKSERNAFAHLLQTLNNPDYKIGFFPTILLATGGFMLMPLGTVFSTHNLGIAVTDLPLLTGITGLSSIVFGPIIGRLCDKAGRYKVFLAGSAISLVTVVIYTNMGISPLWLVWC